MDFESLRAAFPVAQRCLYLDSAHQAPLCTPVRAALDAFLDEGQQAAGPKPLWLGRVATVRAQVAALIGAESSEIAFTRNTSEGLNIAANAIDWRPGDNVVLVEGDHPNNVYAWLNQRRKGVEVRLARAEGPLIDASALAACMDRRTRVVSLSHVASDTGARVDLAAIGALCRQRGVMLVVDAVQSLGIWPVDVEAMGITMLASGCHKGLLVPQGLGLLYVSKALADLWPAYLAAAAVADPAGERAAGYPAPTLRAGAARFETGNLPLPQIHGLAASLRLIESLGVPRIGERMLELGDRLIAHLDRLGIGLVSPRARHARSHIHVLALGHNPLMGWLASGGVRVSPQRQGIRVSLGLFNSTEDVDALAERLASRPAAPG